MRKKSATQGKATSVNPPYFQKGYLLLTATALLILFLGYLGFRSTKGAGAAWTWVAKVGTVLAGELFLVWRNRGPDLAAQKPVWGLANILTLFRGFLIALLAGFLFTRRPQGWLAWIPTVLYTVSIIADYLDGLWARHSATETLLGKTLDLEFDSLGILIAMGLIVQLGRLPTAFLFVGLARYAFALGLARRRYRKKRVYPMPDSYWRRRLAGFQMGLLAAFLWPIARRPGTTLAELPCCTSLCKRESLPCAGCLTCIFRRSCRPLYFSPLKPWPLLFWLWVAGLFPRP